MEARLVLVILTLILHSGFSYVIYLSKNNNQPGAIVFNCSLDSKRIYSLSLQLTSNYVQKFIDVSSQNGLVYLKKSLKCLNLNHQKINFQPFRLFIRAITRNESSKTQEKLVIISLSIYFDHFTCDKFNLFNFQKLPHFILSNNTSFRSPIFPNLALIVHPFDKNGYYCFKRSQFITNVNQFIPNVIKKNCHFKFTTFPNCIQNFCLNYAIESNSSNLVIANNICFRLSQFDAFLKLSLECQNTNKFQLTSGRLTEGLVLSSVEYFDIYFSNEDLEIEYFIESKKTNYKQRKKRQASNSAPHFDKSLYIVNVPEEKEKGFTVCKMTATDPENKDIFYSMSAVLDARSQSMFSIHNLSGIVSTNIRLDREFMDLHYLRIIAVKNGLFPQTGTTTLQINVGDENDHAPIFERTSYEANVKESIPIGSTILSVRASDQDVGNNAKIEYNIVNFFGPNEAFRIDSQTGTIITRNQLDRETVSSYLLTVQASDLAAPNVRKHTETNVRIQIIDENDNYPQFLNRSYSTFVSENIAWSHHPVIATVTATDADEDSNAAIRYSIIGGNTQGHFKMDFVTGEISVIAPLNYESTRNYRLIIRAQDAGSPPRSNTTRMLINVEDVNDNDPKFYNTLFQETVIENTPIGHNVLRVQAYDDDDGQNALITYLIKNYEALKIPLSINNETGWITTTRELDWEETNLYEFTVIAKDNGQPSRSSSASVIIRVQDTNDNDPVFDPKIYEAVVSEIDQVGTQVARVFATDKDENSRLIFQITNGNNKNRFNIISQKNRGIISIAQPLDYKVEKRYILSILVTDNGGRTDLATVYVNVTDANTHRPVIAKTPYAINLAEDTPVGSTVVVIEASDADVGENARITFQMEETPGFKIDPFTGAITTTQKLDRELTAGYTIVVTAFDNGLPQLADTTNVEIEIIDVNDNAPKFKRESYQASISEESVIGTSVQQIFATDDDAGLNGQVKYTFEGGYDGDNSFIIDSTSGMIRTNKLLDRESTSKYELIAYALDSGTPAFSSSVSIFVTIEDVNDNPPRFESENLKFYLPENSPIGTVVGELKATDPDEGPNAKIEYSIVGGPDSQSFQLVSRNRDIAEIITKIEMDFESPKKIYYLIVRASSLPLRNDVDIEIFVTDVNDHAPVLKDFSIIFNNYKNYFPLHSIGKVPVYEADVLDQLHFKFLSGNRANLLIINETSGDIRLSPSLNTNVPTRALFEISVSDGLNEATALCQLSVNLVTEAMLFNSVTIRLNNIKYSHFLSVLFERFLDGLSSIIPCSKENIIILNIQDGNEIGAQVLNISFSARIQDSRELDSFYSSQYLKERIYLSRPLLTKITGLEVLPFDDNLCVHEPCLNFEKCLSILKFGNASDFISSETILFRPINPVNTFACRCPHGFTGMLHKDDCDTEINLCFSSPCLNGGTCLQRESGYTCTCPNNFVGENCEINLFLDLCKPNLCKGNSVCVNLKNIETDSAQPLFKGFECVNCTYSEWSTPYCDLRTRSFPKNSYITFSSLQQRYRFKIKLSFATYIDNSLLFYNGRYNEQHDFIALEIINSKLVFSFSLGSNLTQLFLNTPEGYLTNGQWHTVEISYFNRTSKIHLLNCNEKIIKSSISETNQVLYYVCSNQTTSFLDFRCQDKMQTCYRFFDLTGPFQLGGLPPLPSQFQILTNSFVGCLSDLFIDEKIIDFNSYVANNGTIPGCIEKRGYCQSQPCQNEGTCIEGWGSYFCQCKTGFLGQDCSEANVKVKHFKGDGFLIFSPRLRPISIPWIVKISFKTVQNKGLLFRMQLGQKSFVVVDIMNGNLRYTFDSQSLIVGPVKVNDGQWHFFEANWMLNGIWLNLDYGQYESNQDFAGDIRGLYISEVSVGGLDNTGDDTEETEYPYFFGCIQGLDVDSNKDAWLNYSNERNVYEGCSYNNFCENDPCPFQAQCIDEGLGRYSCKCNPGYVAPDCILACDLNPCYYNSQCIPSNNTRGYDCKCDEYYTGPNCEIKIEERCPSNWWGYSICGPCNCDSNHGYDGNCNQTSGECFCEINHFQPPGSNFCFDCDCYALGSYSNQCDTFSGQCKCRPGVIGRKCDSCASSLAEVTLRGCEVIYEGCPRSFSDGIWWERTSYNTLSNQSCPYGSFGRASRYCDENHGWQSSDLFECTSNIFTDLADKLLLLDKEMLPLTTYLSIKIANDLKTSLNHTETLFGNDAMIAYRLLYHLINHELKQSGLNLTHKQDRYFLFNLIEIASSILDVKHLEYWNKISSVINNGVPEHILQLFNAYAKVLIENTEDTFTAPFELSTQNMIFGLDSVGIDELWNLSRISSTNSSKLLDALPSVYLDFSSPFGPAVEIPKYNNYPRKKNNANNITRLRLPLKMLGLKMLNKSTDIIESRSLSLASSIYPKAYISYAIYPTLGHLLPLNHDSSIQHRFGVSLQINSPIVILNIKPTKTRLSNKLVNKPRFDKPLNPRIEITFKTLFKEGFNNPQCGYWSFSSVSSNKNKVQKGKWSSRGCEVTGIFPTQKLRKSYIYINCSCDRLAAFGVIMDETFSKIFIEESFALNIFTLFGITLSIILLILTLILLSAIRGVQTNSNSIHRNIVLSLLCSIFLFTIALKFRNSLTQKAFSCTMIAIFLHYFFLCNFSWIFVESIHLYRMLIEIRDINHGPMKFYYFVGYVVPAIVVGLSVGVKSDQYGHYLFCWLSIYEGVIWSMLGPTSILSILSVFVFTMAIRASIQIKETVSDYGNLKTLLWLSVILLPLLGSTWVFALFSSNDTYEEINYVFVSLCIISSFYIFIGYCIVNRRVRHNIKIIWYQLRGLKADHLKEKLSGTKISIASKSVNQLQSNLNIMVSRSFGISTSSTTSRSTATKTSSSPYRSDNLNNSSNNHYYKKHKKIYRHRRHKSGSESESDLSYSQPSLNLASSHTSDEDEANISTTEQNQINIMKQQTLNDGLSKIMPLPSVDELNRASNNYLKRTADCNNDQNFNNFYAFGGNTVNLNQDDVSSEHIAKIKSSPYCRSNIIAMDLENNGLIEKLNQTSFSNNLNEEELASNQISKQHFLESNSSSNLQTTNKVISDLSSQNQFNVVDIEIKNENDNQRNLIEKEINNYKLEKEDRKNKTQILKKFEKEMEESEQEENENKAELKIELKKKKDLNEPESEV